MGCGWTGSECVCEDGVDRDNVCESTCCLFAFATIHSSSSLSDSIKMASGPRSVVLGGRSDPRSVVDLDGRVYGLVGLHVAEASVMPDIVRANTHLSTIVIGENIAAKIKHELAGAKEAVVEAAAIGAARL